MIIYFHKIKCFSILSFQLFIFFYFAADSSLFYIFDFLRIKIIASECEFIEIEQTIAVNELKEIFKRQSMEHKNTVIMLCITKVNIRFFS